MAASAPIQTGIQVGFIGVGAPKCATTWLSEQCAAHPEIAFAEAKEVCYFADTISRRYSQTGHNYYSRGQDWYHQQFPADPCGVQLYGEFTPAYFYDPQAAERMRAYNPEAKIIACLRQPADMLYSWYCYNQNGLLAKLPERFEQLIEDPFFLRMGEYAQCLQPYYDRFGPEQIHVILHDDIRSNKAAVLRDLYAFLGIDANFIPTGIDQRVNDAKATRSQSLQRFANFTYRCLSKFSPAKRVIQSRGFENLVTTVYGRINRTQKTYPAIAQATRTRLTEYYRDDITALGNRLGRDLSHWCE